MRTFYLSPARFFNTMLGNLWQIVIANWDDFSDIIPNQAWLMSRMDEMITCCSDGTRPVIFKIERIDYEEKD